MTLKTFLLVLEGLGLVMALLDVTRWSSKLQASVDRHRRTFFEWLIAKGNERLAEKIIALVWVPLVLGVFYVGYVLITDPGNASAVWQTYVLSLTMPGVIFLIFFVCLPLLYNSLLFINKPPSGTVGTFSLVIALLSFLLQRL